VIDIYQKMFAKLGRQGWHKLVKKISKQVDLQDSD